MNARTRDPRADHQGLNLFDSRSVEIEVGEIRDRLGRAVNRHLACPYEPSETLGHFDVHQVGRMELVLVSKEARLDPSDNRRLQEELQQGDASTTITRTGVPLG